MKRRHARQLPANLVFALLFALTIFPALPLARFVSHHFPTWNRFAVKTGALGVVFLLIVAFVLWLNRKSNLS